MDNFEKLQSLAFNFVGVYLALSERARTTGWSKAIRGAFHGCLGCYILAALFVFSGQLIQLAVEHVPALIKVPAPARPAPPIVPPKPVPVVLPKPLTLAPLAWVALFAVPFFWILIHETFFSTLDKPQGSLQGLWNRLAEIIECDSPALADRAVVLAFSALRTVAIVIPMLVFAQWLLRWLSRAALPTLRKAETMPRDVYDVFMTNYGRLYDRLERTDQEVVMESLAKEKLDVEMEQLRSRSFGDENDPAKEIRAEYMDRLGHGGETLTREQEEKIIVDEFVKQFNEREVPAAKAANLALDQSKESPDPAQVLTKPEKQAEIQENAQVIDARERPEATWARRVEDEIQSSLYDGNGQTDELRIRSAGQNAQSWAATLRPDKGPQDLDAAIQAMGLQPAIDRQKVQEAAREKNMDKGHERGGEGIER